MNFLVTWINWGLAILVYFSNAKFSRAAPTPGEGDRKPAEDTLISSSGDVTTSPEEEISVSRNTELSYAMQFMKVYARSICQVRETLVDIFQEYPDEVEYIFKPSCVPLMRCAGCCNDESQECAPLEWYNITMQIMRIKPHISQLIMDMSFQQHSHCECRPKKDVKGKQEKKSKRGKGLKRKRKKIRYKPPRFPCEPCTERRKHMFIQDPQTCKCSCKNTDSRCKTRQLELNERTCRCEKPRR